MVFIDRRCSAFSACITIPRFLSLMECIKCNQPLPSDGRFLKCVSCRNGYHLGKTCSGVADTTFVAMGATKRESWRCQTCRTGELRSGSGAGGSNLMDDCVRPDLSQREQVSDIDVAGQLSSIRMALDQLLSLKTSVESLLPLPAKVDELLHLKPVVEELYTTVGTLQTTVSSFSSKYDHILNLAKANEDSVKSLHLEVSTVQAALKEQARDISRLKEELNDSQQYSRRPNMELHGLPVVPGENLMNVMKDLYGKINIASFNESDVVAIHRLPRKHGTVPPVLIRFASISVKDCWMAARGKLQRLCQTDNDPRLYFNDNLTHANRELFWLARTRGRESGFRFVWLKNGKIFARKAEGTPPLRITSIGDLEKLV